MIRVLLLVHIEEMFRARFRGNYLAQIVRVARRHNYDEVIHLTSHVENDHPVDEIRRVVSKELEWGWGYEREMFDADENRWLIDPSPYSIHDCAWVPPEIRSWTPKSHRITIGGGCDGECLGNLEASLHHLGLPYRKPKSLVYA